MSQGVQDVIAQSGAELAVAAMIGVAGWLVREYRGIKADQRRIHAGMLALAERTRMTLDLVRHVLWVQEGRIRGGQVKTMNQATVDAMRDELGEFLGYPRRLEERIEMPGADALRIELEQAKKGQE